MAQYTTYAQYYIYIRDQAEYDAAIGVYGPGFITINPTDLCNDLGIPTSPFPVGVQGDKGIGFVYPFTPGLQIFHPAASGVFIDETVDSMLVPGQAGTIGGPTGPDMLLVWAATLVKIGGDAGANPSPATPMPQRRWSMGWELAMTGEGGTGLSASLVGCRDASRVADGLGWAFRNQTGNTLTRSLDEYQSGYTSPQSWERLYIRLRTAPSSNTQIWRTLGTISPSSGGRLVVNTNRTLSIVNVNSAGAITLTATGTTVLNLNEWYQLNILVKYAANAGSIRLFIRTTLEATLPTITTGNGGLGQAGGLTHSQSLIGDISGGGSNGIEIDFDTWENSEFPLLTGVESLDSLDWLTGSHVRKFNIVSAAADNLGWTPTQVESLNQMISPLASSAESRYASSTSTARLHGITDVTDEIEDLTGFNFGAVAATIGLYASRNGTADGQIGYSINGTITLATIVQSVAAIFNSRMYRPTGLSVPDPIIPFGIIHDKAASVDSSAVLGLQAVVSFIGTWGIEDDPDFLTFTRSLVIHNAYYANSVWAQSGPIPDAPCGAFAGTYVGNGTATTVTLLMPIHFLWIRPLTGGSAGVKWHAAGLGGHFGGSDRVVPDYVVRVYIDPADGLPKFTVAGNNSQVNELGETFQWVAFADPGLRYNICGAFRHNSALATANNDIIDSLFTPTFMWTQSDNLNQAGSTVISAIKGPGSTVDAGVELDGTALANYATFGAGFITSRASLHLASSQVNYSAWRTVDGSGIVMVQILTYTGDGVASRVIPLTPTSSRFPLFAYVQPANAQGFFRDPSHTGTNSSSFDCATNSTTAITAGGVDTITVGITLNALGIVYNVFVLPGDDAGWNNGDFYPPSGPPPGDVWAEVPVPAPVGLTIIPSGGLILNGSPSLLLLASISGIYTLVAGKTNDTLIDRQVGQPEIDVKIPNPIAKGGYIGG